MFYYRKPPFLLVALLGLMLLTACDAAKQQFLSCNCDGILQGEEEDTCLDVPANNNCVDDQVCASDEAFICVDCRTSSEEYSHYQDQWKVETNHLAIDDFVCGDAIENPATYACARERTCGDLVCNFPCENSNNCASDCQWPLPITEESTVDGDTPTPTASSGGTTGSDSTDGGVTAVPDACADRGGTSYVGDSCVCPGVIDHVVICGDGTKFDNVTTQSCTPNESCGGGGAVDPTVTCGCGQYGAPSFGLGCSNGVIEECNVSCGCKP